MFQSVLFFYFCICCLCRSYILSSKIKKVVTFYHQVLISMWATREAVGLLHFVMLVARLANFHDVLNLTRDMLWHNNDVCNCDIHVPGCISRW